MKSRIGKNKIWGKLKFNKDEGQNESDKFEESPNKTIEEMKVKK